ncbi:MBL fold metallo-hydrolase [Caenibacillus caldisaponilyticus]|uniref:MBL fold metallo-hydrolase n=1 Tax=Caenibacillus caldisaponilyticus TaxID=1674942 RepID=UPI000988466D|nr:MBL fold metallo-hydrolase [Caenibacillus caldisaponilyticus]
MTDERPHPSHGPRKERPDRSAQACHSESLPADVHGLRTLISNVYFIGGSDGEEGWALVDGGVANSEKKILSRAKHRFGSRPPEAIILTHGHFDHVGAVKELADEWGVPIYAHPLELPYLTGMKSYPPADPAVGSGLLARLSGLYPNEGIDLGGRIQPLEPHGRIPHLPEWRWHHTPGHTPGHISLFRGRDRVLIAGDAFITVRQESLAAVLTQREEIHGPPAYFTTDWPNAWESVKKLEALKPSAAFTGHGRPMAGAELARGLERLADHFDEIAIPKHGRYVH